MRATVLNIPFDTYSMNEAVDVLMTFVSEDKSHVFITPNPEIVMDANADKELFDIINSAELVVPDGTGVVLASKFNKVKIKERVTGFDLVQNLFSKIKDTDKTVYFFGGKPGVAELAKKNMEEKYKGLKIVGASDGYFDKNREQEIIKEIQELKPDILLVGFGCPKQEKWVAHNKAVLSVKVYGCIGGSFDIMAGTLKRAPQFFCKLGLEWLFRLISQPSRITRMYKLPLFLLIVVKEKVKEIFVRGNEA